MKAVVYEAPRQVNLEQDPDARIERPTGPQPHERFGQRNDPARAGVGD